MFYDKDSNKVFIYPYEINRKYYLNEFPEYLNGTSAILIKQKNKTEIKKNIMNSTNCKDSSELEIKRVMIKNGDEKTNCFKRQYIIKANLNNISSSCVTTFEYSGFCASQKRTDFNNVFKKDVIYKQYKIVNQTEFNCIDTVNKLAEDNTSPFRYAIRTIGKINNMIDLANDSTITISINKLLTYSKVDHKKERKTNILLPSAYSDIQDLIIEFPGPIKVLNSDTLTRQIDNSIGTFKFDFLKSENNKIHLNTTYIIKKELIPKNSFESLDSINNLINYLLNTKIIVAITK
jgi:hypothetical protein